MTRQPPPSLSALDSPGAPLDALRALARRDLAAFDQGGETWTLYRQACAESLFFAVKYVISPRPPEENRMSVQCHLPVCLTLQAVNEGKILRLLLEDPRKHLKSTVATVGRPVHKLMMRAVQGRDPKDRFGLRSWSKEMAQKFWREISWCFKSNQFFQFLFPELIPDFESVTWNESEGQVPRLAGTKELTFECLAMGTGKAFDDLTEDDLVNEENYKSPTAIEYAIEMHKLAKNLLENDPANPSVLVTVGNDWGMRDVNWFIREQEPDTTVFSRSCMGPNLDAPWANCRRLPPAVEEILRRSPQGAPIWPETFTLDRFASIQREVGLRIFLAHWMNRPSDPESQDFKLEWLKRVELREERQEGGGRSRYFLHYEDDPVPVPLDSCNLYLTWDPGMGGKAADSENAILLTSMDWKRRACVIREYAMKEDPLKTLDVFIDFIALYRRWLTKVGVEQILFAKILGRLLVDRLRDRNLFMPIEELKIPRDVKGKDTRIRAWVGVYAQDGRLYVRDGCFKMKEQYASFGVARAKRDLMDVLAHATRLWRPGESPEGALEDGLDKDALPPSADENDLGITGYGVTLAL